MHSGDCVRFKAKVVNGPKTGIALVTESLSFLGDVDKQTGVILSDRSSARGYSIANKILIMKTSRGSTVGAYVIYSLCKNRLAPQAIVLGTLDSVVASGVFICGSVGLAFVLDPSFFEIVKSGDIVHIGGDVVEVCKKRPPSSYRGN